MIGTVCTGEGEAASFIPSVSEEIAREVGFDPYPGTFNVEDHIELEGFPKQEITDLPGESDGCTGFALWACSLAGVRGAILRPFVADYPEDKYELVAPVHLRTLLDVEDGEKIRIAESDALPGSTGPDVSPDALDEFDAVVFDLDKTLVELCVDWSAVERDLRSLFGKSLPNSDEGDTIANVDALARDTNRYDEYLDLLAGYEKRGVANAMPLPALETIPKLDCPVGICTSNATSAAAKALKRFDVAAPVDVIVGRETVEETKPHPKPLSHCLDVLGIEAGNAIFIGDGPADREAASRTGTSYFHPDRLSYD